MSDEFERYALYWVPKRPDSLAKFGVSWTGWCAEQGELRRVGAFERLSFSPGAVTRELRRHGLHAILRAPFALAKGRSRFTLETALGTVIEGALACTLPEFEVAVVDGRVALAPCEASSCMTGIIEKIDHAIDPIVDTQLTPCSSDVPEAVDVVQLPATETHRFHVPLTDQMDVSDAFRIAREIKPMLAPILEVPRSLHDIALMGDPGGGRRLRVLQRFDLRRTPPRPATTALPVHGPEMLIQTGLSEIAV